MSDPTTEAPAAVRLPAGTLRSGWAWGLCIGSDQWLTIGGSAYKAPQLSDTPEGAGQAPTYAGDWAVPVLARVAEVPHAGVTGPRGVAYRILQTAPSATA